MTTDKARPSSRRPVAGVLWKAVVAIAVLAAGGGAIYAINSSGESQGDALSSGSDLVRVSKSSFEITTTVTGELQAKNQVEVRSQLESESSIMELVPEGSFVKKGDVLVILNSDNIQTKLQEEESRLESAKAEYTAAEAAYSIQLSENASKERQALLKLELAKLAMEQWENGDRVQKLKDIQLALERTEADLTRLEEKYEQSVLLHKEGFLSKNDLKLDEISLREAKAAREKAMLEDETYNKYQEPTERAQKTSDVKEAQAELERVKEQNKSQLASKEADLVNRRRQLQLRSENVAKLQKQLAVCTLRAPQDGLVVYATSANEDQRWGNSGPLMVGRRVMPNENLIILPDTSEMVAQVRVHESLAGRVRKGQTAMVRVDASGGQVFNGVVDSIGILAEGGGWRDPNRREYSVKVQMHNATGNLKPSMRCEATIVLGRVDDAITVPVQAVFTEDPVRFVYVPQGGRFARIPVRIGQRSDTFAEITAGIEPGTFVLVRQPQPAEILRAAFSDEQLKLVGLKRDAEGKIEFEGGRGRGLAGGPGAPGGPGGPEGQGRGGRRGGPEREGGQPGRPEGRDGGATAEQKPAGAEAALADASAPKPEVTPAAKPADGAEKPEPAAPSSPASH